MKEDSMNYIHLTNDVIMGNHEWKGKLELINVIMIGVAERLSGKEENHELHRLLGTLLSEKLKIEEKLDILGNEYHIPMEESMEEDVRTMCNLSEGIEERALERGMRKGHEEGLAKGRREGHEEGLAEGRKELLKQQIQKKLEKKKSVEVIAEELEEEVPVIESVIAELEQEAEW